MARKCAGRTSGGPGERLHDLAGELCPADVPGVREGDRHQGQLPPLLLGRGAGPRDRREEQSAHRRAVRRPRRDLRRRHQGRHLPALQVAVLRQAAGALQAGRRPVDRDRRRSAGVHDQRGLPQGQQPEAAGVVGRPAESGLQEPAADGRRAHVGHGGDAHLLGARGQQARRGEDLRLPEEAAPERAGLYQERRRRHLAGRARPGRRRHLLHRRRARDQGQGLRRGRSASPRRASARRPRRSR